MQLPSSEESGGLPDGSACPNESSMLAFVEGRLAPGERSQIDLHLASCSECRQLVSALAQGGLVLGDTRHGANATPVATALLDPSPFFGSPQRPGTPSTPPGSGAAPSTSPLLRPGDRVADRYLVERIIGTGGMGVVVAAKHLGLGRTFAIKLLDPRYAGSTEATNRFLREARASAQLHGEHVVQVTDMGETILPDRSMAPFLVMELIDGTDLSKTTATKKPLPPLEAVWIILQACEALAEAHAVGIVHRDIKPANLIVTRKVDGAPHLKVVDFGISKAHDIARSLGSLTSQNVVMGTPRYMAPEQMRSSRDVDGRADVWALGAVLYELLAGAPAFEAPSLTELITRVQLEEPTSLTTIAPLVPAGLASVVHRCLRKTPDERVASVADLAELLAPYAPAAALHHVERARRSLHGGRPSFAPSVHPSAKPFSVAPGASTASAEDKRPSVFGIVALSGGALLVGAAATAAVLLLKAPAPAPAVEAPTAKSTTPPPSPSPDLSLAPPTAAPLPSSLPPSTASTNPAALRPVFPSPPTTAHNATLAPHAGPSAAPPTAPPHAVTAAPQPSAVAPEDPHSLRQRQ